ncbi:Cas10/Cmr2 second palm domain-containing protein [Roseofilum casamattae]|uniref:Cas10/Cmr2 second palm domain-containing protein n=1 Tax=Roseofilum casamattae BLCC-M143 TaxID=3022442 RepID=A0ABT7BSB4_9CYAN|nr:hypothetical protein [Roseofilum casamattae]MDJ1182086.1 hypothetical protein [Roseofilum casamattae BLCC-M143]
MVEGKFDRDIALSVVNQTWKVILEICRYWIEDNIVAEYHWKQAWKLWEKHAFNVIHIQGETISRLYEKLANAKHSYNWTGINWQGESSSLSGINAIAWPGMDIYNHPNKYNYQKEYNGTQDTQPINDFYQELNYRIGNNIIPEVEDLNILELVQWLATHEPIFQELERKLNISPWVKTLKTNLDCNRDYRNTWMGWFKGNGDPKFFRSTMSPDHQAENLTQFSLAMTRWGRQHLQPSLGEMQGNLVYASGEDFLGVFNNTSALPPSQYLQWLYQFNSEQEHSIWQQHRQPMTLSAGFVWAAPKASQQDILHHSFAAERSAKQEGRDRLALRVLFASGNYLEWVCPWRFLQPILAGYRDRNGGKNWRHIYQDVARLESRHGFDENGVVALALFHIYFGKDNRNCLEANLWNTSERTGILGNFNPEKQSSRIALTHWIVKLAKIGFYLCR